MKQVNSSGFILPHAFVLAAGILVLATLFLDQEIHLAELSRTRILHLRAESALRLNAAALVRQLELDVFGLNGASARITPDPLDPATVRPVLFTGESPSPVPLYQDDLALTPADAAIRLSLSWSAEDLALTRPDEAPPEFWPLPAWDFAPWSGQSAFLEAIDAATQGQWRAGPWIPPDEPLPFIPAASPAFVPVVTRLALKFGVFASGPVTNREKVVRIRFYIEGELWNPYNRSIQLHGGSATRSLFRALFFNLPELRLLNLSNGASSSWISIDDAVNSSSGQSGLHAWIKLPGLMDPGQHVAFFEPDPASQPEGLARTVHPGFMVGPGDAVKVEFRAPVGGTYVALMPASGDNVLESAIAGEGWYRLEGFQDTWPALEFPRADSGQRPFYLPDGSLSFQIDNAHIELTAVLDPSSFTAIDPRRQRILHDESYQLSDSAWLPGKDWIAFRARSLMQAAPEEPPSVEPAPDLALFSWPAAEPNSFLSASDLPQWLNVFLSGSPGAALLNARFERDWDWADDPGPGEQIGLQSINGTVYPYRKFLHINGLSPEGWARTIAASAVYDSASDSFRFPVFPHSLPEMDSDHLRLSRSDLANAAESLVAQIQQSPFSSVAEFFNRGTLVDLLPVSAAPAIQPALLPLRAWLRDAPPPRRHGASWLLHVSVEARQDQLAVSKDARVWLLEQVDVSGIRRLEIIRFEWIHSAQ